MAAIYGDEGGTIIYTGEILILSGGTVTYNIPHGLPFTPSKVWLTPRSQRTVLTSTNTPNNYYVANITATNIVVEYVEDPGGGQLQFDWFAIR